jgi:hypothetical protein
LVSYRIECASGGYVCTAEKTAAARLNRALIHRRGVEVVGVNW